MPTHVSIREAQPGDALQMLRLNSRWEHFMSRLDADALERLRAEAALVRVAVWGGDVAGFLLGFEQGAAYDSTNYRWFAQRFDRFLYVDRVVVDGRRQRSGVASALYDDAIAFARSRGLPRVVCEIDVEPLNAASVAFHDRRGFVEVGTQRVGAGRKLVSLRESRLD